MPDEAPTILGAVSSSCSLAGENQLLFLEGLSRKCEETSSLQIIVNLFDAPLTEQQRDLPAQSALVTSSTISGLCNVTRSTEPSLPSCVRGVTRIRGYKMMFLKYALTPDVTAPFDFVWYFDNDMDVGANPPQHFRLYDAVRTMRYAGVALAQPIVRCVNTSILQRTTCVIPKKLDSPASPSLRLSEAQPPAPTAGTSGLGLRDPRHAISLAGEDFHFLTRDLESGCRAQLVNFVEQQTPIFSREGWDVFYSRLLARLPDDIYLHTDRGPDAFWCSMMEHELPHRRACAVLATPIIDGDFRTIDTVGAAHNITSRHLALPQHWINAAFPMYRRSNISKAVRFNVSEGRGPCVA